MRPRNPPTTNPEFLRARIAVGWVFAINGFAMATWISRLPAIRDEFHLTPGRVGLVLLGMSAGSVAALPASGFVVHHLRPRRAVLCASTVCMAGLAVVGMAPRLPVLVVGLVALGVGTAVWDVAMNVEGAAVERLIERAIMPRFHAGFSLGTVAGAIVGAGAAATALPLRVHLGAVALVVLAAATLSVRAFLPDAVAAHRPPVGTPEEPRAAGSGTIAAWREGRTLAIGLLVLGMALAEGSANDWLALSLVDGYRVDHAVAAAGYGVFVSAMTGARMSGPAVLARLGRVVALRGGAALVMVGVLIVVAGSWVSTAAGMWPALAVAAVGALAWGCGASLGFPVGMSAASDEPARAAARVSVVSTIGYTAFLAGPPVLGLIANRVGVVHALLAVSAAVVLSLVCASAARPTRPMPGIGRTVEP